MEAIISQVMTTIVSAMRTVMNSPLLLGGLMAIAVVLKLLADRQLEER